MRAFKGFLVCCWLIFNISNAGADTAGFSITAADKEFLSDLNKAVRGEDAKWIADHISYPITAKIDGQKQAITDGQKFIANYANIFNEKVRLALESQQPDALFKNWRGVRVGNGEMWFAETHPDPKKLQIVKYFITGINN